MATDAHVPYGSRPEWKDVKPVPQDDGPNPVVAIAYAADAQDAFNYFRAVLAAKDVSARALALTADVISHNAANYTAWYHRRLCLEALGSDLRKELEYVQEVADCNPKNYQIWHHRRVVVEKLADGSAERAFTDAILAEDSKNYHAWAHRQWAVKAFGLWDDELAFVDALLAADVRNNSAWNHRWLVVANTTGLTPDVLRREVQYTFGKLARAVNNPSPWSYLLGLLRGRNPADVPDVAAGLQTLQDAGHGDVVELLSFRVRLLAATGWGSVPACVAMCSKLCTVDPVRRKYWMHVASTLRAKE